MKDLFQQVYFIVQLTYIILFSSELEDPIPVRYSDVCKQEKIKSEMGYMLKKKKGYLIAPDGN